MTIGVAIVPFSLFQKGSDLRIVSPCPAYPITSFTASMTFSAVGMYNASNGRLYGTDV